MHCEDCRVGTNRKWRQCTVGLGVHCRCAHVYMYVCTVHCTVECVFHCVGGESDVKHESPLCFYPI